MGIFSTGRGLRLLILLAILVSTAGFSQAQTTAAASTSRPAGEWNRFRLEDGEFSVLLPAAPALSSYKRTYKLRPSGRHLHHLIGAYHGGAGYIIRVFETKQSLAEFIGSYDMQTTTQFTRSIKAQGLEGKEYAFADANFKGLTQFLATKNRSYVFSALSSTLVNPDLNLQKFFESISFGSPTEGNVIHEGPSEVQLLYSLSITKEGDPPPFVGREVTQKARVLSKPEPTYTEEGRQTQTTGTVVLRAVFSETGEVIKIRALSGLPHGLTQKAIDAARQIKFIPAIKDGRFVSTHIQLEYNFNLY